MMKDFTKPKTTQKTQNIKFKLDDDVFEAYPKIGAELMASVMSADNLAKVAGFGTNEEALTDEQRILALDASKNEMQRVYRFLDDVLLPDSAQRFAERLRQTGDDAIDVLEVFEVYHWLISEYGQRPTQPSSPLANGHGEIGTSSTVGVPLDPSTLSISRPTAT